MHFTQSLRCLPRVAGAVVGGWEEDVIAVHEGSGSCESHGAGWELEMPWRCMLKVSSKVLGIFFEVTGGITLLVLDINLRRSLS